MLNKIKNSLLCKCLQVLLIGYFLMSSMNIALTFDRMINENTGVHSVERIACNFLKKIFKCDGIPEELDDYKTKETKAPKLAKGTPSLDYLVPLDTALPNLYFQKESQGKNYIDNPIFSFGFHGKIHLPPPEYRI